MFENSVVLSLLIGALLPGAVGLSACSRRMDPKPSAAALAGTWTLDAASLPSVKRWTGKAPENSKIVIFEDGRLQAVQLPIEKFNDSGYRYFNGEGSWMLWPDQRHWMLDLGLRDGLYPVYLATGSATPTSFYSIVDGPDSGERWVWTKSASVGAGDKR